MRIIKTIVLAGIMAAATTGLAQAQGFIGGGTPDAQNGARGRDQPTSFQGGRRMYSGRSAGYGYGPRSGYGYRHHYGYIQRGYYAPY